MNNPMRLLMGLVLATAVLAASPGLSAQAQTTTSATTSLTELQTKLQQLLQQVAEVNRQIEALRTAQSNLVVAVNEFREQMREGSRGEAVKALQEALASDPTLYPEGLITGYYGRLTAEAIKRFQERHGIENLGIVGPKTLAKLNEKFVRQLEKKLFGLSGLATTVPSVSATTTPKTGKVTICHNASRNNPHTIVIDSPAWPAHLAHGDTIGPCPGGKKGGDDEDEDEDDVIAPVINNVTASSTTAVSTHILWTTNEAASGSVWYGTTTPATMANTLGWAANASLMTSHDLFIDGLTASTTYYYFVASKDAAGNNATSSQSSFTTQ